jgi:hypothetical protein
MTIDTDKFLSRSEWSSLYEQQISALNPDFDDLDPEEQELRDSIDSGEWVSELTPERLQELQEAARNTLEEIYPS